MAGLHQMVHILQGHKYHIEESYINHLVSWLIHPYYVSIGGVCCVTYDIY